MKFDNGNEISFFKVLSSESAKYIQVPTPFAKKYLEKGNNKKIQTIVLKTKSHVEWNVEFLKIKAGYYFTDGWFKFMKDNHLQKFDFLVFFLRSHSPKLTFEVFSYATNGCPKSLSSRSGKFITAEKEIGCDDWSKTVGRKLLQRVIRKSYVDQMPLTRRFVKAVGIEGPCYLKLENDEGKIWDADLRIWGRHKIPFIATGWADFMKDNKLNIGSRCDFSHVKGNILHVHVIKRTKAKRLHAPSTLRKREVTDLESEKAVDSARKFNSDYPYYCVPIRDSYIRCCGVDVHVEFCRRYLTYDKKCVTCVLHSPDGGNWGQVQCKEYRTCAKLLGRNWKKFSDENHLGVGDVCVFELINDIENVLKVTIIRG